jgi:hypothetical protein
VRSHLLFTFQHRAGVRPYTSSYDFAESCVFIKQSLPPILCHWKKIALISVPLLPKLRGQFAEFLQRSSPKRLSLLDSPTCVGLGYGLFILTFSWKHLAAVKIHLLTTTYMLRRTKKGYWIIRSIIPIGYSLRFDLRDRLTVRSLPLHTNPWAYGDNVSRHYLSLLMSAFSLLISPAYLTTNFHRFTERSATPYS